MKRSLSTIFCAVFGLTGCSTHLPEHNATVNVDAITFAILTELYCAANDLRGRENELYFASDDFWVAGIDMYLSASIEASANPSFSLLGPFNSTKATPAGASVGSFTALFSGSIDETRTNMREYKIYVYLKRLVYGYSDGKNTVPNWKTFAESNRWPVYCENPNAGGTFLQGRLGLKDWLAPAVRTQEASVGYAPLNAPPATPAPPPPPTPTITDVFPNQGSEKDAITLTGTNLDVVTAIVFDNDQADDHQIKPKSKSNPGGFVATKTTIQFHPLRSWPAKMASLTVRAPGGDATSSFTFVPEPAHAAGDEKPPEKFAQKSTAGPSQSGSGQQSPTISGTFTFTIKSTGTIGPSFVLTRVSGGSSNLFTATR